MQRQDEAVVPAVRLTPRRQRERDSKLPIFASVDVGSVLNSPDGDAYPGGAVHCLALLAPSLSLPLSLFIWAPR